MPAEACAPPHSSTTAVGRTLLSSKQLGPQTYADDPERGQRPVPALSHHGYQVRGATAALGKAVLRQTGEGPEDAEEAAGDTLLHSTPRAVSLPSALQQPELAELRGLEGRRDPHRGQRRRCCASDTVYLGVSSLQPSEGRKPSLEPTFLVHALPCWQCKHCFLEDYNRAGSAAPSFHPTG
ncbi:sugar transporter SWEET1 isoform X7 [Marmota marmota marmota]|uniref:sugar transporter SWEET1 isoform X7 n=1 Tax=Marmota marmota marmota TaxID=9994 RepID=UPI002091FA3E|nr:sugar transporter SWEET1 isoform X7 [Marmota marmota marmota]